MMESEVAASEGENTEDASFSDVSALVAGWMFDFMFVSLCRRFKEGELDEYNETLSVLEAIAQDKSLQGAVHKEKLFICAFLTRVTYGKELDVEFDEDKHLMPLMSATKVWWDLEHTVDDETLFRNIESLLFVQTVAVCLEKGQTSSASSALKWLEKSQKCPKSLRVKLSTVMRKMETYDPFLRSFSFDRLLEMIRSYLDTYLKKNPSDYLLKAATEVLQSSKNMERVKDEVSQDSSGTESPTKSVPKNKILYQYRKAATEVLQPSRNLECLEDVVSQDSSDSESPTKSVPKNKKTKRKLLPSTNAIFSTPDAFKSPCVSIKRLSKHELSQVTTAKPLKTSVETYRKNKKRTRMKWNSQLDKYLKDGVKSHGVGKWSLILKDYDFKGRTGTMLKDRWRILIKTREVE
ncbi:telomeric repeat-binding factor 1 isoform X1 [Austrofundulus limnaeus]|uniref:Telomeric repeat-binding factor n=1 Tax=Austrofundulus limnaeus TaxID=52670 RepID=A0A2I4AQL7_AUSLI|nr:PREDICTED: telomeric repeat-binding factor 1 isoform X1 [Austrofundulus limnaeus]